MKVGRVVGCISFHGPQGITGNCIGGGASGFQKDYTRYIIELDLKQANWGELVCEPGPSSKTWRAVRGIHKKVERPRGRLGRKGGLYLGEYEFTGQGDPA